MDKVLGFEGLSDNVPPGHEDEWKTTTLAKLLASKKAIDGKKILVDEEEKAQEVKSKLDSLRAAMLSDVNDDDIDLDADD